MNNEGFSGHDSFEDQPLFKPTSRLPPKLLHPRHGFHAWRKFVPATTIALIAIIVPYILLRHIKGFSPLGYIDVSCDLASPSGSHMENAFNIDLRSPLHLSFGAAKGIDVVWDLVIGQGGRLLLAWVSYIVFMDGLIRLLETSAIPYHLYSSITFNTSSLISIWQSLKTLFTAHGWRAKAFLAWFTIATIYVLGFSTLLSAVTGYVTPSTNGYLMPDQSFVTHNSDDLTSCYVVMNGSVVGLQNNTIIPGPPVRIFDIFDESSSLPPNINATNPLFMTFFIYFQNFSSNLPDIPNSDLKKSGFITNITVNNHKYVIRNYDLRSNTSEKYCHNNQSYDPSDLEKLVTCLPESYFVWGFSSLLLYIMLPLQIIWTIGMYIVWLDANINSRLCCMGRTNQGYFRTVLDLAEAMKEVVGDESCAYSEAEISRELAKTKGGIRYYTTEVKDDEIAHIGLSSAVEKRNLSLRDHVLYGSVIGKRKV